MAPWEGSAKALPLIDRGAESCRRDASSRSRGQRGGRMGLTKRETQPRAQMADLELFYFDQPDPRDASLGLKEQSVVEEEEEEEEQEISRGKWLDPGEGAASAPRTESRRAEEREETETSFTCKLRGDEDDDELIGTSPQTCRLSQSSSSELYEEEEEEEEEDIPELYLLSDDDLSSEGSGKSVDYGFIIAVTCLVTGISLVAISYTVPRDVRVDPDSVSAREMERLEREKARVGAHLDRCVIAGLCLLTLGGVLLSTLLMISMWKGEMMRRKAFAYSKHAAKLYGSINLRAGSSPTRESCSHLSAADEDLEVIS
ncbi:transmembrane protein 74-like [Centropristis striata]|uniref:transmembrane protein 74-like n=1 Tax=Centropristis striata TaxID=184440 RepID=UPI0027E20E12|nr:transmembrane protein 74-like [Centropristis striata]